MICGEDGGSSERTSKDDQIGKAMLGLDGFPLSSFWKERAGGGKGEGE